MVQKLSGMKQEVLRKLLHLTILGIIPIVLYSPWIAIALLGYGSIVYIFSERFRLEGGEPFRSSKAILVRPLKLVQFITVLLSRNSESKDIVWAPLSLSVGVMLTIALFPPETAMVGITCLAFGDTAAMLVGRSTGGPRFPLTDGKCISGSIACWIVCLLFIWVYSGNLGIAVAAGAAGAFIEALQLDNADNILLPIATALCFEIGMYVTV